jgi:hypothetical protein
MKERILNTLDRWNVGRPLNTTMLAFIALAVLLFIPLEMAVKRLDLFELVNALCMAASFGFCVGYASAFWQAIRLPVHRMTTAHMFVTGAWIMHFSAMQIFGIQFIWRLDGQPTGMLDSVYVAFTRWQFAIGVVIMMATSFSKHGDLLPGTYGKIAVSAAILIFIVASFLTFAT